MAEYRKDMLILTTEQNCILGRIGVMFVVIFYRKNRDALEHIEESKNIVTRGDTKGDSHSQGWRRYYFLGVS